MQLAWSRIWTRVAVSISYDDNHYTTGNIYISFGLIQYKTAPKYFFQWSFRPQVFPLIWICSLRKKKRFTGLDQCSMEGVALAQSYVSGKAFRSKSVETGFFFFFFFFFFFQIGTNLSRQQIRRWYIIIFYSIKIAQLRIGLHLVEVR